MYRKWGVCLPKWGVRILVAVMWCYTRHADSTGSLYHAALDSANLSQPIYIRIHGPSRIRYSMYVPTLIYKMAQFSFFAGLFALIFTQRLAMALLVGFTSSHSFLRPMLFPPMLLWSLYMLPHYSETIPRTILVVFCAGEASWANLHYVEKILLRRWSYDTASPLMKSPSIPAKVGSSKDQDSLEARRKKQPPTQSSDGEGSLWNRLRFRLYIAFSDRYIGSPYQVAHTPPYSASNPSYIPSRPSFILHKISILGTCYLMLDILTQLSDPSANSTIYSDTQIPFASRLWHGQMTIPEMRIRTATSIGFWFACYLLAQSFYGAFSLLAVCAGVSRPELARPVFGSIGEAYTLRGFWGRTWHQLLRGRLTSIADRVTYDVLALPRSSAREGKAAKERGVAPILRLASRYTHLLVCFFVSGLMHQVLDLALGLRWGESHVTFFFVLMAVGIMAEDAVQWVWYDVLLSARNQRNTQKRLEARGAWWSRIIGYLWVVVWFSISTPYYAYPNMSRNEVGVKDEIVPFSVVRWMRQ